MNINDLYDWQFINAAVPFIGMVVCAHALFSVKTCTQGKVVSTSVVLLVMLWLVLLWADWGSGVFVASYQTMMARVIILIVSLFIMYEIRRNTARRTAMRRKNRRLIKENRNLRVAIAKLSTEIKNKED